MSAWLKGACLVVASRCLWQRLKWTCVCQCNFVGTYRIRSELTKV